MRAAHALPQSGDFSTLGLSPSLQQALGALGYQAPTAIQRAAMPLLLQGRDVLGQAATGTGKTAAFGAPLIQQLEQGRAPRRHPAAAVLVPTRELALQVAGALYQYGGKRGVRVVAIYGGQPISSQMRSLRNGADVIVATPGRLLDHLQRGSVDLGAVQMLVLDEADEMLDMGFADDLDDILGALPDERQTALFSATMPRRIDALASRHLRDPVRICITPEPLAAGHAPAVRQVAYMVPQSHKTAALLRLLAIEAPTSAMVFCRTRGDVDGLSAALTRGGQRCEALHGGLSQPQRDRVMQRFRGGDVTVLVATDVAARGLDIDHVSHVVNHELPSSPEVYVHRIGRTGRAGRKGVAISLVAPHERRLLLAVERRLSKHVHIGTLPTLQALRQHQLDAALEQVTVQLRERADDAASRARQPMVAALVEAFPAAVLADLVLELAAAKNDPGALAWTDIPTPPAPRAQNSGRPRQYGKRHGEAEAKARHRHRQRQR